MSTYLITGAAGFIGSHLAEALLKMGHLVVGLDNFHNFYSRSLKEGNVRDVENTAKSVGSNFAFVEGDVRNADTIEKLFSKNKIDAVFHLAALAGVRPSIDNPIAYWDVNCTGTATVLEGMKQHGIKNLVFASSSSIYGNSPTVPFHEDMFVGHPISPYAATKRAGELLCYNYSHLYGIHTACIRFFTVYGPRQRPDLAIHKFSRLMTEGKPIPVFGDGSTSRDYTYVSDIVDGVIRALDYTKNHPYEIINLGESNTITLSELIVLLEKNLGVKAIIDRKSMQPGDVERTWADVSRAREKLGYSPKIGKEEGIAKFVEWFKGTV